VRDDDFHRLERQEKIFDRNLYRRNVAKSKEEDRVTLAMSDR